MTPKLSKTTRWLCLGLLSCILVTSTSCFRKMARASYNATLKTDQVNRLKERKVVFIVPQSQYEYFDDYKELLPKAWTLTPLEVVRYNDLEDYNNAAEYSYFDIHGIETTVTRSSGGSYTNTHYYLSLSNYYPKEGKSKKAKQAVDELCRIELYPEFGTTNYRFSNNDVQQQLYLRSTIRNFTLPYMMAYLRFVQKNVEQKKNPWVYDNYTESGLRAKLAGDTLYVPEGVLYDRSKWTGKESEKGENFFSSYKGKYKIVSNRELIDLIKGRSNSKKPLFLFEYVLSSTDKYVSVLDATSGTVVYRRYTPLTYNIKDKDIKRILED